MRHFFVYCVAVLLIGDALIAENFTDSDLITSNNRFTFELYRSVSNPTRNTLISPHVVSLLLAALYHVASEQTASDIQRCLRLPEDEQLLALHLQRYFPRRYDALAMNTTIHYWTESGQLNPLFVEPLSREYGFHFVQESIERYSKESPREKLQTFTDSVLLYSRTRMAVTWQQKFSDHPPREFQFVNGEAHSIPMMRQTLRVPFLAGESYDALELPYASESNLTMLVVVPKVGVDVFQLGRNFSVEDCASFDVNSRETTIGLTMPQFRVSSGVDLGEALEQLGMKSLFERGAFDIFLDRDVSIAALEQGSLLRVDTTGTEHDGVSTHSVAVAYSAVLVAARSMVIERPFLYLIRNRLSKEIIMMGHFAIYDELGQVGAILMK